MRIRAPHDVVEEFGTTVKITSDDHGVVVKGGQASLRASHDGSWWEAGVPIEGRELGAKATITARLAAEAAHCRVNVEEKDTTLPPLRVELAPEGEGGIYRALFDPPVPTAESPQILKVMTKHKAIRQVLGEKWEGQDTPEWLTMLAEVVTDAIVRRLMERKYPRGVEGPDAQEFYIVMYGYSTKLLPLMHRTAEVTAGGALKASGSRAG